MEFVQDFWIMNSGGVTLFWLFLKESDDNILVGSFLTAIKNYIENLQGEKLTSIVFGNSKLTILHGEKDLFFVVRTPKAIKENYIRKLLKTIEKQFMAEYGDRISNWDGNVHVFKNFKKVVLDIFSNIPIKRIKDSLW